MNNLKIALTALVLLAPLSASRAAAETVFAQAVIDSAAIQSAIGNLKRAQAEAAPPSEVPAPTASESDLKKLLDAVKANGKYVPQNAAQRKPGTFTLEESSGDLKADHTSDSVQVAGILNQKRLFEAKMATIKSEDWKLAEDGSLTGDVWMFMLDIQGSLGAVAHGTVHMKQDGTVIAVDNDNLNPADPRIKTKLDAVVAHWAATKP